MTTPYYWDLKTVITEKDKSLQTYSEAEVENTNSGKIAHISASMYDNQNL